MVTHGNKCDFSFYVRAFDTKARYSDYRPPQHGLSLQQAKEEFQRQCSLNPRSVDTVLGLDFTLTAEEYSKLRPRDKQGAVDLLKCSKGTLHMLDDYKSVNALQKESLISVNTINILRGEAVRLQELSDTATQRCAEEIRQFLEDEHTPEETQNFIEDMCEKYGVTRCQYIMANELRQHGNAANELLSDWLKEEVDPNYTDSALSHIEAERINVLCEALYTFTETQSKLLHTGLINGDRTLDISDKSNAVIGEIERHNELEDGGYANEDQLSL